MEPALDVIGKALQGDPGACSFLDRTSSIYVLDATDSTKPKTYGCWNFIHQAMNEVERYEASFVRNNQLHSLQNGAGLNAHVKLLATMALRVARRSPTVDSSLVSTCVANAESQLASNGTPDQSQWLVDLNLELREIVMGRIAAMAFDFSFHRQHGPHGHSAFADPAVMEVFCAVLASNAVSSGPLAVRHFLTEWIVPSAKTLPPYAVACVTLHLALSTLRNAAPAGSKDVLQQLSAPCVASVLGPVLVDAVSETTSGTGSANTDDGYDAASHHERNNLIAATCIRALERWCAATDLSLAQIKHICSKVEINFVDVISDAMYSDSIQVVDALAELIEAATTESQESVLEERMTQVRYLLQVDEASFQSNFSAEQLNTIEVKEMSAIVDELVSAIGLQRFRFIERQNNGDHDVCRSLVRLGVCICSEAIRTAVLTGFPWKPEPGLVDLILKGAAHPSVNISGIALQVLPPLVQQDSSLALQVLPLLQRRAITPHHTFAGVPSLAASDICGVNFHEFQNFRGNVLADALRACYAGNPDNYVDSCTSAIEEFCSDNASSQVSLHLEAALFCMSAVAEESLGGSRGGLHAHSGQLQRCTSALSSKPISMTSNPLTLAQTCLFIRKYTRWYGEGQVHGVLDIATDLALYSFNLSVSSYPGNEGCHSIILESSVSPSKEAALTLREILCHYPKPFVSNSAITALGAGWEASYAACNRKDVVTIEDREAMCAGICHVLAALPQNQRIRSFHALALPALDCFDKMTTIANAAITEGKSQEEIDIVLSRVADEILIFTGMSRTFTNACYAHDGSYETTIPTPLLGIIRKVWPSVVHVAAAYSNDERVAKALGRFLVEFLPPRCDSSDSLSLLKELCSIAFSILKKKESGCSAKFTPIWEFLKEFVKLHGETVDRQIAEEGMAHHAVESQDVTVVLSDLLLSSVDEFQVSSADASWTTCLKEQRQGQPAFESKSERGRKEGVGPSDELCGMFTLFQLCVERCPAFFLSLPAAPDAHDGDDLLYCRAVDTALNFLGEPDASTSMHAMSFVDALLNLTQSRNDTVRSAVFETIARVRPTVVSSLLLGACGKLSYSALGDAAQLLISVVSVSPLTEETRASAIEALKDPQFRLGDEARNVVFGALEMVIRTELDAGGLIIILEQLWDMHQLNEVESLETSDVVARFVKRFRR